MVTRIPASNMKTQPLILNVSSTLFYYIIKLVHFETHFSVKTKTNVRLKQKNKKKIRIRLHALCVSYNDDVL